MPDGRNGIPLPSRSFECPVSFPVTDRSATVAPDPSLRPAGAHIPEADAAQRIAADPSVIDAERDPLYGDRVQHKTVLHRGSPAREALERAAEKWYLPQDEFARQEKERVRLGRLSRWQEQR